MQLKVDISCVPRPNSVAPRFQLDGPNAGQVVRDDEPDFYAAGAGIG